MHHFIKMRHCSFFSPPLNVLNVKKYSFISCKHHWYKQTPLSVRHQMSSQNNKGWDMLSAGTCNCTGATQCKHFLLHRNVALTFTTLNFLAVALLFCAWAKKRKKEKALPNSTHPEHKPQRNTQTNTHTHTEHLTTVGTPLDHNSSPRPHLKPLTYYQDLWQC